MPRKVNVGAMAKKASKLYRAGHFKSFHAAQVAVGKEVRHVDGAKKKKKKAPKKKY